MAEFEAPDFLQDQDIETVHERMIGNLPDDIDVSAGSHPYNLTRPVAYEVSYLLEDILSEALALMFPKYCEDYDEILDDHAEIRGLERKAATYATGVVTVTGDEGVVIPVGELFETLASNDDEDTVISFEATEAATIPSTGSVDVPVQASEAGADGNVAANTIVSFDIEDVETVTNAEATTGGADEEDNESLQERIMEYDENKGNSFVGSVSDYRRWAEECNGVGNATIIAPTVGGDPIRVILTDEDGEPVTQSVQTTVYNYIMGVETDGSDRLAPINASITVETPTTINLYITATIVLDTAFGSDSLPDIKAEYAEMLNDYLKEAPGEGVIKYSRVCRHLSETEGISDFSNLQMRITDGSYAATNISVSDSQYINASVENIVLTVS